MKMFQIKRSAYEGSSEQWIEYINISSIVTIEGHIYKNAEHGKGKFGYDVYLNGGHKIWIDDEEMKNIMRIINHNEHYLLAEIEE